MKYICIFCDKEHLNKTSLTQHQIRCIKNPNKIRTKHSDETKKKLSATMKVANNNTNRIWSEETLKNKSIISKIVNK
jgi:uncharacterized protein YlbG (UPF0298 family)